MSLPSFVPSALTISKTDIALIELISITLTLCAVATAVDGVTHIQITATNKHVIAVEPQDINKIHVV